MLTYLDTYNTNIDDKEHYLIVDDIIVEKGGVQKLLPLYLYLIEDPMTNLLPEDDVLRARTTLKSTLRKNISKEVPERTYFKYDYVCIARASHCKTYEDLIRQRKYVQNAKRRVSEDFEQNNP